MFKYEGLHYPEIRGGGGVHSLNKTLHESFEINF